MKYERLFQPIKIGNLEARNRIEAAPTLALLARPDGSATTELVDYYRAKAKGGAGIVTVGESYVDAVYGPTHLGQLDISHDSMIPSLSLLADGIKSYGALASLELCHGGRQNMPEMIEGRNPIGPSPISSKFHEIMAGHSIVVQEMTEKMIDGIIESFASAALRLKRAGFDMVMLHGGHGWMLAQFLSPFSNKRTDKYGGSLENRARFPLEVIERIREKVGYDFAIDYRMSGDELVPGGITPEMAIEFAKMIQDKVDCLNISVGMMAEPHTIPYMHPPAYLPNASNVYLAEMVKNAVHIPVSCVGGITSPELADEIIKEGRADIVALARALIVDPEFPNKAYDGRAEDIIPCSRCLECHGKVVNFLPIRCANNPIAGRETELKNTPLADTRKNVLVVGGGPGGMEAAAIASERGHQVTLCERSGTLGGNLSMAAIFPFKTDMRRFLDFMIRRINKLPIELKLETDVDAEFLMQTKPDVLILAIGADSLVPEISGIENANVTWPDDILTGKAETGESVLVAGGGMVGCEIALILSQKGKKVSLVEKMDDVATELNPVSKILLLELLEKEGVQIKTCNEIEKIDHDGVEIKDSDGQRKKLEADTIVLALGSRPRSESVEELKATVSQVYVIGDCKKPRRISDAIREGFNIAIQI